MSSLDTITAYLQGKGLGPVQVAGVEGNLLVESKFEPTAANPREQAIGIAQWEGDRRTGPNGLQAFARARGTTETDLPTQLDFMWSELQGPESGAYRALMAATTPTQAATAWAQKYERSASSSLQNRVDAANGLVTHLGGTPDHGSSGGGPLGGLFDVFSGWQHDLMGLGLKVAAAGLAGALVVVGSYQALHDRGTT